MSRASEVLRKAAPLGRRRKVRVQEQERALVPAVRKPQPETEIMPPGEIIPPDDENQINKYYESLTKSGKYVDEKPVEVDKAKLLDVFKEMSK